MNRNSTGCLGYGPNPFINRHSGTQGLNGNDTPGLGGFPSMGRYGSMSAREAPHAAQQAADASRRRRHDDPPPFPLHRPLRYPEYIPQPRSASLGHHPLRPPQLPARVPNHRSPPSNRAIRRPDIYQPLSGYDGSRPRFPPFDPSSDYSDSSADDEDRLARLQEDLTQREEDLVQRERDMTAWGDELSFQHREASGRENELSLQHMEASRRENEATVREQNLSRREDEAMIREQNLIRRERHIQSREEKLPVVRSTAFH
ncbi:hypothetical protein BU16DRAFT_559222 [Lophium mytilinum]|uniref:Uncharacterized protein n=1 Tax=Lophium mytilinum TaxID=390894 RepID=A0A6A6R265_9PEZI|nr:hypothetical protein BU16DRAFT_559222 [Lophium mytilinum]